MDALIVSRIMVKLQFYEFLRVRLVSKLWANTSLLVTEQWYWWLEKRGRKQRVWTVNELGDVVQRWQPKTLKTAPLYQQVFRQGCKKRLARLRKERNYWASRQQRYLAKFNDIDWQYVEAERAVQAATRDAAELEQRYLTRKRRKIDISKLTDK